MASPRDAVIDWAEQERIAPGVLPQALDVAGVTPDARAWKRFIESLLLSLGALLLAAGIIFFFAYNWQALGRFQKLALVQGLFAGAAATAWYYGPDRLAGRAALLLAALLTGALFALIGQTYQTGADTWQLFATWAALITPWVFASRMPVLWLLLLALVNLALGLYIEVFRSLFGLTLAGEGFVRVLFIVDGLVLVAWEFLARRGPSWMRGRLTPRLIGASVGTAITVLAVTSIIDEPGFDLLLYAGWLGAMYAYYRRVSVDLFMLAGGVLSVTVVVAAALGRLLIAIGEEGGFLVVGLVVVGLSAAGAWWLRQVAVESER